MLDSKITMAIQRANAFETSLGPREDDTVHPSLEVHLANLYRREEASLAGSRPPSGHQSACDQGWSPSRFVGICSRILSKISGGRVTDGFRCDRLGPSVTARRLFCAKGGIDRDLPIITFTIWLQTGTDPDRTRSLFAISSAQHLRAGSIQMSFEGRSSSS